MRYDTSIQINNRIIDAESPAYFIADIAANHDGDLARAKELIWMAKEAGADAAKFQHFKAEKIVSDYGFRNLKGALSHQSDWEKSVYDTYKEYECNRDWNEELALTAKKAQIDFMTTPYDYEAIHLLDQYIPAYKIGSGDVTWVEFIEEISKMEKPVILATGASSMEDVERAVESALQHTRQFVLLQCNTNYTGDLDNFRYINLKVLQSYALKYPQMLLGLSDHTPGHATVLGAIALGAKVIEKHFTDDNNRIGPDHKFSMNPLTWKDMMERSRELELALGDGTKRVENNEKDTVVVQRRCLRVKDNLQSGHIIREEDLEVLRPAPQDGIEPYRKNEILGKSLKNAKRKGDALFMQDLVHQDA
ncbi:N,N'-diacetyllegionaminic acid synthase [compost metagenome]